MSSISEIVSVSITQNTRTPSQVGFGTPLFLGYDSNLVAEQTYTIEQLSDVTDLSVPTSSALYRMCEAAFNQSPRVAQVKIASTSGTTDQLLQLTPLTFASGAVLSCTVVAPDGTETDLSQTCNGVSIAAEATAFAALVDAISGVSAAAAGDDVNITVDTSGQVWGIKSVVNLNLLEETADEAYDTALTAIEILDDDWYGVAIDMNSEVNVDDVAAWVESRAKLFIAQTSDTDEKTGSSTLGDGLNTLAYEGTGVIFAECESEHAQCAALSRLLAAPPGSFTLAHKELIGVTPSSLTATQRTAIEAEKMSHYTTVASLGVLRYGWRADGDYLDTTIGIDWLTARIQERVFGLLANVDKLPFTDASVERVKAEVYAQLQIAVDQGLLRPGTISVSGPLVADVSDANKAARLLPDIEFGGELAGAVHKVTISGTVSL